MSPDYAYTVGPRLLTVKDLCVDYDLPVLKNVNFTIDDLMRPGITQGQKVAVLAPSGTGKTQLFKRLAGLEPASSGQVLVGIDQKPVHAGEVGMVPQNYYLFEHYTVGQSLVVAAKMREKDTAKAKGKALTILETMGLSDKWNVYPSELSGGQRQRVSIAEQLLSSDHFLLMDEPFSGLDVIAKKIVCNVIDRVASRDELNTIIFTTHDIESAVMIADHILVLGRDRDQHNAPIPGAYIKASIDLIDRDLAWHNDVEHQPNFAPTVADIKSLFTTL